MATPHVRVHEIVADLLTAAGVECIFGVMGEDTAPLMVSAAARGIRCEEEELERAASWREGRGRVVEILEARRTALEEQAENELRAALEARTARSGAAMSAGG